MSSTIDMSNVTLLPPSGNETAAWCILAHAWKYLYITRVHGLKAEESLAAAREVVGSMGYGVEPDDVLTAFELLTEMHGDLRDPRQVMDVVAQALDGDDYTPVGEVS